MKIKSFILIIGLMSSILWTAHAQQKITGVVFDAHSGQPIEAVTILLQLGGKSENTDRDGRFVLRSILQKDSITISHVNYHSTSVHWDSSDDKPIQVLLIPLENIIEVVDIQSGYNQVSKEKAVGSFATVGKEVLERTVSANILDRLDGVSNGLSINRVSSTYRESDNPPQIRVRGVNTIFSSSSPLIVVDNFPYEGNIEDINPNDVENVTFLKDASASSIWGTRAGNGVIVITTKKGAGRPKIEFNSNFQLTPKPDIYMDRSFLDATTIMEIEKIRFDANGYAEHNLVPLPDYVELLFRHRYGQITDGQLMEESERLRGNDIRRDALKYLYRNRFAQQYFFSASGTHDRHSYYLSGGYNKDLSRLVGDDGRRTTIDFKNNFKLLDNLNISAGINFTSNNGKNNGLSMSGLGPSQFKISPYTQLVDGDGDALAVPMDYRTLYAESAIANGLIDWQYRPLDEINLNDKTVADKRFRFNIGSEFSPIEDLKLSLLYQYQYGISTDQQYRPMESYYVRNLVNRFTQADGTQIIPHGGIWSGGALERNYQYGRMQANYSKDWQMHNVTAFAGAEMRQEQMHSDPSHLLYNYNNNQTVGQTMFDFTRYYPIRPEGTSMVPGIPNTAIYLLDRFLSFYGNLAYSLKERYLANFSARWDGANIFGVRTNQRGTPLWSAGLAWTIDREEFFSSEAISTLKLRATYGYSGNVNKNISTVPIMYYINDSNTGLTRGILQSTGNPDLRWEKVSTINIGVDAALKNRRISASMDYYVKYADDLIGFNVLDPTTGIFPVGHSFEIDNRTNYANMLTKGLDVEVSSLLIDRRSFKWNANLIFNYSSNRITKYLDLDMPFSESYFPQSASAPPQEGKSIDVLYALPWNGLDPQTGNPVIYLDGEVSQAYSTYYSQLEAKDLIDMGVTVPRFTTSIRNGWSYKDLSLSFLLSFKGGHKFRRPSINYSTLYNGGYGHSDYHQRWTQPGDELFTEVPSMPAINQVSLQRERIYLNSESLIENADHLRLQDINITYDFRRIGSRMNKLRLFFLVSNVGVLWRSNDYNIDPDYPISSYPPRRTYSLGVKVEL